MSRINETYDLLRTLLDLNPELDKTITKLKYCTSCFTMQPCECVEVTQCNQCELDRPRVHDCLGPRCYTCESFHGKYEFCPGGTLGRQCERCSLVHCPYNPCSEYTLINNEVRWRPR